MKVVSFSLDPQVLNPDSVVASRSRFYGEGITSYTIIVPGKDEERIDLSPQVTVMSTGGANKLVQLWNLYQKTKKIIKTDGVDVITSQDTYFLALVGYFLAKKYHLGLEVQVHGIEKLNWFRKQFLYFTINRASTVRLLSQSIKRRLKEEFGLENDRMAIVPIYVDVSSLGFDESKLNEEQKAEVKNQVAEFRASYSGYFNFVAVNRLVPVKNIKLQLKAVAKIKDKYPNIRLHIVGDGPLQGELEKMVSDFGIQDHVVLHGPKFGAALSPFFTETDCFVLTSHSEGWGMVIVEAATAGLPVIMTEVGCAGEIIKDDESGYIIPDNDLPALLASMEKMMGDEERRQKFGKAAMVSVANLSSFEEIREQYYSSWKRALENKF